MAVIIQHGKWIEKRAKQGCWMRNNIETKDWSISLNIEPRGCKYS